MKNSGNKLLDWKNSQDFHHKIGKVQLRTLSLKQLLDLIGSIYESKNSYDKNCIQ